MPAREATTVFGHDYRIGRMSAMRQFHVTRRLSPILASLGRSFDVVQKQGGSQAFAASVAALRTGGQGSTDVTAVMQPVLEAISNLKDDDAEFVVNECLRVVEREEPGGKGWAPVMPQPGVMMFSDIEMPQMLTLTFHVLRENLADFFLDLLSGLSALGQEMPGSDSSAGSTTG